MSSCLQGVIQGAFEIGKKFWVHQDWHPYFDKLMKKNIKPDTDFDNYKNKVNKLASYMYKLLETNSLVSICYYHSFTLMTSFILKYSLNLLLPYLFLSVC